MSDKEHEIPVKVVDRRWWANQEHGRRDSRAAIARSLKPTYVEELEQTARREGQAAPGVHRASTAGAPASSRRRGCGCAARSRKDIERGRREILADLLDVVDNLDRAIDAARAGSGDDKADALLQGVELVRRQFLAKLEGFGVKRIESEGQPFDPSVHEAISAVPATDAAPDGTVVGVVRHGYRIGDDVLRPASVAVAKS